MSHVPVRLPLTSDDPNEVMRKAITYAFAIARMYGKADGGPVSEPDYLKNALDLAAVVGTKGVTSVMGWPEQIKNATGSTVDAAKLPGDVVTGKVDPLSDEGVRRAVDLAGSMTLGAGAMEAPAGALHAGMMRPKSEGIIAYHGSPHSFDRFDLSKIGTGEGAQAYGHGLYFADSENVAKSYRDVLSQDIYKTNSGETFDPSTLRHLNIRHKARSDLDEAIEKAKEVLARPTSEWPEQTFEAARADLAALEKAKAEGATFRPGSMYQVRINADPERFLDWDRPLSEQSPVVQHALAQQDADMWSPSGGDYDPSELGQLAYSRLHSIIDANRPKLATKYGDHAYFDDLGRLTSKELNASGIPGIRYLDQGSRAAGEGSRNYVVFDDKLIDILRRYATGGEVSAPITGQHTISLDDLIGRASSSASSLGAYTDAGGQKIASPFVTSMANGYPVYSAPAKADATDPMSRFDKIFGRRGYDEGGVADVENALRVARETQDQEAMSHPVGMSGKVEFAPVRLREPLSGYEVPLGSIPKESAPAANAMLDTAERFAPYAFGPGFGAAYDMAVGAKEGSMADVATGAFGLPGKALKAAGIVGSTLVGGDAEAGPIGKALNYTRRLTDRGFYSPAAEALAGVKQEKGRVGDFINAIRGKPGVSKDELAHAGIENAFAPNQTVTRDEVMDYLHGKLPNIQETVLTGVPKDKLAALREEYAAAEHGDSFGNLPSEDKRRIDDLIRERRSTAKFEQYSLPGGENYREVLLHLPVKPPDTNIELGEARPPGSMYGNKEYAGRWQGRQLVNGVTEYPFKIAGEEGTITHWPQTFKYNGNPAPEAWMVNAPNMASASFPSLEAAKAGLQKEAAQNFGRPPNNDFRSQHWDEPNVLAHLRMSDRDRALHIDEIQSDWGQAGRDNGFRDPAAEAAAKEAHRLAGEEINAARAAMLPKYHAWEDDYLALEARNAGAWGLTPADLEASRAEILKGRQLPVDRQIDHMMNFIKTAEPITLERFADEMAVIRAAEQRREATLEAAHQAGSGIIPGPYVTSTEGWTDLALKRALREAAENNFDNLVWTPGVEHAARYNLSNSIKELAYNPRSGRLMARAHAGNNVGPDGPVKPEELASYVGKETAQKLLSQEPNNVGIHSLRGDDLSIGGQGMLDYYDKIVPVRLQKLLKKLGHDAQIDKFSYELPQGHGSGFVMGHSLRISPELREAIMQGLPAFRRGGEVDNALTIARQASA